MPPGPGSATDGGGALRPARRALGAALLGLTLLPFYRLLAVRATGPAAEQMLRLGRQYFTAEWAGLVAGVLMAALLSALLPGRLLGGLVDAFDRVLVRPPAARVGVALGAIAAGLSSWVSLAVLQRQPVLLDGVAQLVQARYLASGRLAGPALIDPAFWQFQFMVPTSDAWASQYPPGFPALLALFGHVGAAWLAGPILLGAAVWLTTLAADRLLPGRRRVARGGVALMAMSWFLAFHAGAYMNHALALALVALAVYASLRALSGSWLWALLSGAAVGGIFATRPLVAVVLGFFATVLVWAFPPAGPRPGGRAMALRLGAAVLGATPWIAATLLYDAHVFGGALRFGYLVAAGPAQGLGFHADPWGSRYGLAEAAGFTSADLLGLSLDLLQTPLPALLLVGAWLTRSGRLGRGEALAGAWALLPIAANTLYWHHDLFMGPRLLYEAAPGWCLLVAAACSALLEDLPEGRGERRGGRGPFTRPGVAATLALALVLGEAVAGPSKVASYGASGRRSASIVDPPAVTRPTLVFVHDDWESRLGARMAALGVRLDSIRAALNDNSTCTVEEWVGAREDAARPRTAGPGGGSASPAGLDFDGTGRGPSLRMVTMPSGAAIRTFTGEALTPRCEREAASDWTGLAALPPLLWQGDLPGLGGAGAMFVRDLGPERNARLVEALGDREPAVVLREGGRPPRLVGYAEGMWTLWKERVSR